MLNKYFVYSGFGAVGIVIAAAILVLLSGGGYFAYRSYFLDISSVACTQEAKQCSDGSYVGRTGPNCEFAPCPKQGLGQEDTSSWKTYRNEKYRFEMKYPPIGTGQTVTERGTDIVFIADEKDYIYGQVEFLTIRVYSNDKQRNISNWFVEEFDQNNLLLGSGAFKVTDLSGGDSAIVWSGKGLPDEWLNNEGPIGFTHVVMSGDMKHVFVFFPFGQEAVMLNGVPMTFASLFVDKGFSTFKFLK